MNLSYPIVNYSLMTIEKYSDNYHHGVASSQVFLLLFYGRRRRKEKEFRDLLRSRG